MFAHDLGDPHNPCSGDGRLEIDQEHGNVALLSPRGASQCNGARLLIQHGALQAGLLRVIRYTMSNYSRKDAPWFQIVSTGNFFSLFFLSITMTEEKPKHQ